MSTWRSIALVAIVAVVGALGTLAAAAAAGMRGGELVHLLAFLAPAVAVTIAAAVGSRRLLLNASVRQRSVAVALVGAVVAVVNLAVLSRAMFVSGHDATLLTILVIYAAAAGVAVALVLARATDDGIERLSETARRLGAGDLEARVGVVGAGEELDRLGAALDEMAERLQEVQAREREAEQMRRDLITTVSHDLRTPLASLRAMVEAVDDGVVEDPLTFRRYAAEMRRSTGQLSGMVDDLFELTQLDVAAIRTETRRVRLVDAVRSAVDAVQPQATAKRLSVTEHLDGASDASCSPRVTRVLQNLLTNAVRHTPADGTVTISAERSAEILTLAVEDDGEGISAADLPRVFEPFFRADPARSGPGAGLGLALAKRIVEALGGSILAENRAPTGARFSIVLPG